MKFNSKNKKSFYFGWKEIAFIAKNDKMIIKDLGSVYGTHV